MGTIIMSIAWDKLHAAAITLAGSGTIKERLAGAYISNLADLDQDQLPAEIRPEFDDLCQALHRVKPNGNEGPVLATVRKMSNREADDCAQRIVTLYGALAHHQGMLEQPVSVRQLYAAEG